MSLLPYMTTTEGLQIAVNTLAERGGPFSKDEIKILEEFRRYGYSQIRLLDRHGVPITNLTDDFLEKAYQSYNNLEVHYAPLTILCLQFELAKRKTCTSPKS